MHRAPERRAPDPAHRRRNLSGVPDGVTPRLLYLADVARLFRLLVSALEGHVTQQQNDDLTAIVSQIATNVGAVATEIASEISDLAAAVAAAPGTPSQAVTDAITSLTATNERLTQLVTDLQADNAPVV